MVCLSQGEKYYVRVLSLILEKYYYLEDIDIWYQVDTVDFQLI